MKTLTTTILAVLAYLGTIASCVWAIVEFILYLVKDKVFNWWSIWMILICGGLVTVMIICSVILSARKREHIKSSLGNKSLFQERLKQMAEERKNRNKNQNKQPDILYHKHN